MRVFVYRNLHKKCLSVRDVKSRRVIAHVDSIALKHVRFKVSEKGRNRVLLEKVKNVHAGVEGFWVHQELPNDLTEYSKAVYDPYKYASFVSADTLEPQLASDLVYVTIHGVFFKQAEPKASL